MTGASWIEPSWPRRDGVGAAFSLRYPGFSAPPYDGLNLGAHVGDTLQLVEKNRLALASELRLPAQPAWLQQVHGTTVVDAAQAHDQQADAVIAQRPGQVCAVMVADCLPVLLRSQNGACVAAVHAGWRGLAAGVIESALQGFASHCAAEQIEAWLGPCIGPSAFEVGPEVRSAFTAQNANDMDAFTENESGRFHADLQRLARQRLQRAGVEKIWATPRCTVEEPEHFYSFRREGVTGRMAALIWRDR